MDVTNLYVTITQMILQSDPNDANTWSDIYSLFPNLRKFFLCIVCENLVREPFTPLGTDCQHHVCNNCQQEKKNINPACKCSQVYTYTENKPFRPIVQCYKRLCMRIQTSSIFQHILNHAKNANNSNVGGIEHGAKNLIEILRQGAAFEDNYVINIGIPNSVYNNLPNSQQPQIISVNASDNAPSILAYTVSSDDDRVNVKRKADEPLESVVPATTMRIYITSTVNSKSRSGVKPPTSTAVKPPTTSAVNPAASFAVKPPPGFKIKPLASFSVNLPVNSVVKPPASSEVNSPEIFAVKLPASSEFKLPASSEFKPPASSVGNPPNSAVKPSTTSAVRPLTRSVVKSLASSVVKPSTSSEVTPSTSTSDNEEVEAKPIDQLSCQCGNTSVIPGNSTCASVRCPCYVDSKPCIRCRCRGCRNPNEPDDNEEGEPTIAEVEILQPNLLDGKSEFRITPLTASVRLRRQRDVSPPVQKTEEELLQQKILQQKFEEYVVEQRKIQLQEKIKKQQQIQQQQAFEAYVLMQRELNLLQEQALCVVKQEQPHTECTTPIKEEPIEDNTNTLMIGGRSGDVISSDIKGIHIKIHTMAPASSDLPNTIVVKVSESTEDVDMND